MRVWPLGRRLEHLLRRRGLKWLWALEGWLCVLLLLLLWSRGGGP